MILEAEHYFQQATMILISGIILSLMRNETKSISNLFQ